MNETEKNVSSVQIEERKRAREKVQLFLISAASVMVFLGVWETAVRLSWVNPQFVCSPSEAFAAFVDKLTQPNPDGAVLGIHIWESLKLALIGYVAAAVIGVPLGLLLGYYRTFDRLINPIFEIIRPIPPIAWIPLSVIWLGIGTTAKCFIIFLAAFVPCVINSYTGVKLTNSVLIDVAKTCGASRWKIFITVCTPSAMPLAFTGVRVALGNAWSTLVAAEMLSATAGLGYMIQQGRALGRSDIIIVGMLTIGVIGAALTAILNKLENRVIRWRAK